MEDAKAEATLAWRERVSRSCEQAVRLGFAGYGLMLLASFLISVRSYRPLPLDLHELVNRCGARAMAVTGLLLLIAVIIDAFVPEARSVIKFERQEPGQLIVKVGPVDWVRLIVVFVYLSMLMTILAVLFSYIWRMV